MLHPPFVICLRLAEGRWSRMAALPGPGRGVFASFGGLIQLADPAAKKLCARPGHPSLESDKVPYPNGTPSRR